MIRTAWTSSGPTGVGCRSCPRLDCEQRAHLPAGHRVELDETQRMDSFYVVPTKGGRK